MKIVKEYIVRCEPEESQTNGGIIIPVTSGQYQNGYKTKYPTFGVLVNDSSDFTLSYRNHICPTHDIDYPKPGDILYFHQNAIKNNLSRSEFLPENEYFVTPSSVYFVERDGELRAIGPFCLVELIPEKEEDIKTKSGLFVKSQLEHITKRGILLKKAYDPDGDYAMMNEMDMIVFSIKNTDAVIKIKIKGKEYARVDLRHIDAVEETVITDLDERKKAKEEFHKTHLGYVIR